MFGNKDNITSSQLTEALAPLLKRIDELEKTVKKIKADNKSLNEKLSAMEEEIATLKEDSSNIKDGVSALTDNQQGSNDGESDGLQDGYGLSSLPIGGRSVAKLLYLPSPTASGTFASSSTEEEIGKSIYLLHTDDGKQGTFEVLQTPDALATATISVSQFLKPVCRIVGNTHIMPEKIETIEEGEAQKEDEEWVVTKKAVVKFE